MTDNINPAHYTSSDIECIEAIRAALTPEEFRGYCKGNAIKYVWRERMKGGNESLQKANWYMDKAVSVSSQPAPATPAYPYLAEVAEHMTAKAALREAQSIAATQEDYCKSLDLAADEGMKAYTTLLADGWIEWGGGECPIHGATPIDARLSDGDVVSGFPAGDFHWQHKGVRSITHYRIAKEQA